MIPSPYTGLTADILERPTTPLVWPDFTDRHPNLDELALLRHKIADLKLAYTVFKKDLKDPQGDVVLHEMRVPRGYVIWRFPVALITELKRNHRRMQKAWKQGCFANLITHMRTLDSGLREVLDWPEQEFESLQER